ncbi:MAG: hypothetical protein Q4E99_02625 [Bacillota bacterium]|nr:hypothetical protein [Bacillota bacterium]
MEIKQYSLLTRYGNLKPKEQTTINEQENIEMLINILINMIRYNNLPNDYTSQTVRLHASRNGLYCMFRNPNTDKLDVMPCQIVGTINPNRTVNKVIAFDIFGSEDFNTFELTNGVDCVVGYNNSIWTPDRLVERFGNILTQIDISFNANVKLSRKSKMFGVTEENEKTTLTQAFKEADNGSYVFFNKKTNVKDLLSDGNKFDAYDLTDAKDVDKLQYLTRAYNDILDRFLWYYGISRVSVSKLAQQNSNEIDNGQSGTMVLCQDMLTQARDFCDKCNAMFGLNMSAEFGDEWERKLNQLNETTDTDGDTLEVSEPIEESEDDGTDEE